MRHEKFDLGFVLQLALNALNVLFLAYLLVYVSACPSSTLVGAVTLEFGFYFLMLGYRFWKLKQKKSDEQIQLDALHNSWKTFGNLRTTYRLSVIAAAMLVFAYLAVDLTALCLAKSGNLGVASDIYRVISIAPSPSIHPGFSMELLAGGYIESKQFRKAEPIFFAVEKLRRQLVGERSELIADIYANIGDLYEKSDQNESAESYYIKSIQLAKDLHLRQGYGSPMTKLATLYTKERRFTDAEAAFNDAVEIRTKIFGSQSEKVVETKVAYAQLLRLEKKDLEAASMESHSVAKQELPTFVSSTLIPVSVSAASVFVCWKRDRILLFAANLVKNARAR